MASTHHCSGRNECHRARLQPESYSFNQPVSRHLRDVVHHHDHIHDQLHIRRRYHNNDRQRRQPDDRRDYHGQLGGERNSIQPQHNSGLDNKHGKCGDTDEHNFCEHEHDASVRSDCHEQSGEHKYQHVNSFYDIHYHTYLDFDDNNDTSRGRNLCLEGDLHV